MKTIEKNCLVCDTKFLADTREHNRGNAKFCSLKCSCSRKRKEVVNNTKCDYCGTEFYRTESKKRNSKSGLSFCCREHKDLAQRIDSDFIDIRPDHYGTGERSSYRISVLENKEKKCEKCGYDEHPEILEVHHKDRNRKNNKIDNLEFLCPNCHMWDHYSNNDGRYKRIKKKR